MKVAAIAKVQNGVSVSLSLRSLMRILWMHFIVTLPLLIRQTYALNLFLYLTKLYFAYKEKVTMLS